MGKAVIYIRVSDSRQVDNTSLEAQERICRSWCQGNGVEVDQVFKDAGESAKTADRTQFQRMFAYLKRMRGSITHLVVYKLDRFSRSVEDQALYGIQLKTLGIRLQSATEAVTDTPSGRAMQGILAVINQLDNEVRGERALNGMKARVSEGRWCWTAPTGYLSGGKNRTSLVPDPVRAPLIARLFDLVSSGQFSAKQALDEVTALGLRTEKGKRIPPETLGHILRNPIYYGWIEIEDWGISVRGDFPPLISQELFDRVQRVLSGRVTVTAPRPTSREEFPLRGTVLCTLCKKPLTAAFSTGKKKKKYGYYRCFRASGHANEPKDRVERAFINLLERLEPRSEHMALIERIFRQVWTKKRGSLVEESEALKIELARLENRKKNVLEAMADGGIRSEDFKAVYETTLSELSEVKEKLDRTEATELDLATALNYLQYQFWNTNILWQESDLAGKISLQKALFPDGVSWESGGLGTPPTHSIFKLLPIAESDESLLVGPEGFEPPTKGL
jgi:site-specific DNA recombinase